jgi:hypothetical protein
VPLKNFKSKRNPEEFTSRWNDQQIQNIEKVKEKELSSKTYKQELIGYPLGLTV